MINIYLNNDFYNSHKKFNPENEGFGITRISNLYNDFCSSSFPVLFVYEENNKPIAFLKLYTKRKSSYFPNVYNTFSFIDVKNEYKNKGIATQLIVELIKYLKEHELNDIVITSYEEEGKIYLKNKLEKMLDDAKIKAYTIE